MLLSSFSDVKQILGPGSIRGSAAAHSIASTLLAHVAGGLPAAAAAGRPRARRQEDGVAQNGRRKPAIVPSGAWLPVAAAPSAPGLLPVRKRRRAAALRKANARPRAGVPSGASALRGCRELASGPVA